MTDNSKDSHKILRLALESTPSARPASALASRRHAPLPGSPVNVNGGTQDRGPALQLRLLETLMTEYWDSPNSMDDRNWLVDVATRVGGFSQEEVIACLDSEEWARAVEGLHAEVGRRGIASAVPVFVIQGKYVVSGWQKAEQFIDFFERIRLGTARSSQAPSASSDTSGSANGNKAV
jgi:hypothetical protein